MASLPTQRSLAFLRASGYTVAIVEHWNAHVRIRQDLFGFGDLLCLRSGEMLLVQTTSDSNASARVNKILGLPVAKLWLETGARIVVHGWGKKGARGERKLWKLREIPITLRDFEIMTDNPVATQ